MRRFTRLTNGFSKKVENHMHSVSLHYMYYNFCRIHQTLRVTPAMEAGVTNRLWSIEDILDLIRWKRQRNGLNRRMVAWHQYYKMPYLKPFWRNSKQLLLSHLPDYNRIIKHISEVEEPIKMIFIDTLSQSIRGWNENSSDLKK